MTELVWQARHGWHTWRCFLLAGSVANMVVVLQCSRRKRAIKLLICSFYGRGSPGAWLAWLDSPWLLSQQRSQSFDRAERQTSTHDPHSTTRPGMTRRGWRACQHVCDIKCWDRHHPTLMRQSVSQSRNLDERGQKSQALPQNTLRSHYFSCD
jgi:hypothetical protein